MIDWGELFVPQTSLLGIFLRGTIMYLTLFALLRVVLKRESGATGVTDLLVIVLIADASQNAMSDGYTSITEGILLVGVILGWSYVLNRVAYHWKWAARIIRPHPLLLVRNGRLQYHNLRRELLSEEELLGQLRQQGIDDLGKVREVRMEADGHISVIPRPGTELHKKPEKPQV